MVGCVSQPTMSIVLRWQILGQKYVVSSSGVCTSRVYTSESTDRLLSHSDVTMTRPARPPGSALFSRSYRCSAHYDALVDSVESLPVDRPPNYGSIGCDVRCIEAPKTQRSVRERKGEPAEARSKHAPSHNRALCSQCMARW